MNAVLDTNVLVSGIIGTGSPPAQVIDLFQTGRFQLILDHRFLCEYRDVLTRPKLRKWISRENAEIILHKIEMDGILVEPRARFADLPDPDDAPFLETAHDADAVLVTGNTRHFPVKVRRGVRVMTPREFVSLF